MCQDSINCSTALPDLMCLTHFYLQAAAWLVGKDCTLKCLFQNRAGRHFLLSNNSVGCRMF